MYVKFCCTGKNLAFTEQSKNRGPASSINYNKVNKMGILKDNMFTLR